MSTADVAAGRAPSRRLEDRLNPILVKEVRQALRGRFFRVMFWITLGIATLSGLLVVAEAASAGHVTAIGRSFFMVIFGCMSAAVHGFTPFSAFLATSAEWDENTLDLLVLSNLRPRQIVSGKLFSALIQALLYYSTFGPFLVFAFLLNGIDLLSISVILACSLVTCVGLSLVGIALASLRAARGFLMAVFGAGLAFAWFGTMGGAVEIVESPQVLRSSGGQLGIAFYLSIVLVLGLLFATIAVARFAHEEENRSTGMRVLSLGILFIAGGWGAWMCAEYREYAFAFGAQGGAALVLYGLWLHFLTEPAGLGRRTAKYVTPKRWLALVSAPFLPGGGLAVLLFFVHAAVALLGALLALRFSSSAANHVGETLAWVLVFYGYAFAFLALPAGLASFVVKTPRGRMWTRIGLLLLLPVLLLGPALVGLLLGIESWMEMRHPLNPFWVLIERGSASLDQRLAVTLIGLCLVGTLTLAVNAPRLRAAVREVLAASRARREAEQREGAKRAAAES